MKFKFLAQGVLMALLTCFSIVSCNGGENAEAGAPGKGYQIKGQFAEKTADIKVTLEEILPTGLKAFDSTKTDEQGGFEFKGVLKGRSFYLVRFNGGDIPLYLDSVSRVSLSMSTARPDQYDVKGQPDNIRIKELIDESRVHFAKLDDLQRRFPKLPEDDSTKQLVIGEFQNIMRERKEKLIKLVENQASGAAGIFTAIFLLPTQDMELPDFVKAEMPFYEKLDKKYAKSMAGFKHYDFLHAMVSSSLATAIGHELADINLPDPDGNMIKLSSMRGKYVLVDFWASWCKPCRMENPNVVKAYKKYHNKGFEILGVSLDENAMRWKNAIQADQLDWKHVSELKGWQSEVCRTFNINSIPFSILLDKNGVIIATNLRGEALEQKLKEVLGE